MKFILNVGDKLFPIFIDELDESIKVLKKIKKEKIKYPQDSLMLEQLIEITRLK